MKLSIPLYQVGREKAEKHVLTLSKKLGLKIRTKNDLKNKCELDLEGKLVVIDPKEEIDAVMKTGKAKTLQMLFDSNDRFLSTPLSMAVIHNVPGLKINISSSYGNHTTSLEGQGLIEAPEISFSEDIAFYRKAAVESYNDENLEALARNYRGYLQSCISLVDCFLHRYTFHIKELIPSTDEYENTRKLDSRAPIGDRLDAWMTTFAFHKKEEFKHSKERTNFFELKKQRNNIVHPSFPTIPYNLKEVVRYINYAKDGIGGLLAMMRRFTGYSEYIGFICRVSTLKDIKIVK